MACSQLDSVTTECGLRYGTCRQFGLPHSVDFHMVLRQNGQCYALFTFDDGGLPATAGRAAAGLRVFLRCHAPICPVLFLVPSTF